MACSACGSKSRRGFFNTPRQVVQTPEQRTPRVGGTAKSGGGSTGESVESKARSKIMGVTWGRK